MKKYLEYKDEKSNKFWEITVLNNVHTVRYGKIGSNGQIKSKEFVSKQEALKDAEKLFASKIKNGYVETVDTDTLSSNKENSVYSEIVNSKNLGTSLCKHFDYLADSPGSKKVLETVMSSASSAKIDDDKLIIYFNNISLDVTPPDKSAKYAEYAYLFKKHSSLSFSNSDIKLFYSKADKFFSDLDAEELEEEFGDYYDDLKNVSLNKIVTIMQENSDIWLIHPKKKKLIGILHDADNDESSYNPGTFFLLKMIDYLGLKVEKPEIKPTDTSTNDIVYTKATLKESEPLSKNFCDDMPESGGDKFIFREKDNTAYFFNGKKSTLLVYEISNFRLINVAKLNIKPKVYEAKLFLYNDYLVLFNHFHDSIVLDIHDYKKPTIILTAGYGIKGICIRDDIVYFNRCKYNRLYEEKNGTYLTQKETYMPEIPKGKNIIQHWNKEENPNHIRSLNNMQYLLDGIYLQKLGDKKPLRKTLKFSQGSILTTINHYLVAITFDDIVIFDISDPIEPILIGSKKFECLYEYLLPFPEKNCIVVLERNRALSVININQKTIKIQAKLLKNYNTILWERQGDTIWLLLERKNKFFFAGVQIEEEESIIIAEPFHLSLLDQKMKIYTADWRWMKFEKNQVRFLLYSVDKINAYLTYELS